MNDVPVIDISGLSGDAAARLRVAGQIGEACERIGFFCISGHGVDRALVEETRSAARAFFAGQSSTRKRYRASRPIFAASSAWAPKAWVASQATASPI